MQSVLCLGAKWVEGRDTLMLFAFTKRNFQLSFQYKLKLIFILRISIFCYTICDGNVDGHACSGWD